MSINEQPLDPNPKTPEAIEKRNLSFKRWYSKNKESLSLKRKERYASDTAYREQIRVRSKARLLSTERVSKRKPHTTIPELCAMANVSVHTYVKYQRLGLVPLNIPRGTIFTQEHVAALVTFMTKARAIKYLGQGREELLAQYSSDLKAAWVFNTPLGGTT